MAHPSVERKWGPVSEPFVRYREAPEYLQLTMRRPTTRYLDRFLRLRCAGQVIEYGLAPNAKEVTESMAASEAAIRRTGVDPADPKVVAVCIGDGVTPRTAGLLSLRTAWTCVSIDPALRTESLAEKWRSVDRLYTLPLRIETAPKIASVLAVMPNDRAILVVLVHAHVSLEVAMRSQALEGHRVVGVVAIPCCGFVHHTEDLVLTEDKEDWGIWSEHRRVMIWQQSAI